MRLLARALPALLLVAAAALGVVTACVPSDTHICVTFDAGRYAVNTGSGPVPNGELTLTAGKSYTFEVVGNKFSTFPLALTSASATRATAPHTEGVTGKNPASQDGDELVYTPSMQGSPVMSYQSMLANGLGGRIKILNTCAPSPTRICVYVDDDEQPPVYAVNYGPSPLGYGLQPRGDIVLNAGTEYTFQGVGSAFSANPLSLTTSANGPATAATRYNAGIAGTNPIAGDGQTFTYTPARLGPSALYYHSTNSPAMGGTIGIVSACVPSAALHHICVTHTGGSPGAYIVDTGTGGVEKGSLTLSADVPYTFEMTAPAGVFEAHPFALCESPTGPCAAPLTEGVTGDNPGSSDNMMLTFTPPHFGVDTLYYQSLNEPGMGGKISIVNTCNPSETNICVWNDGTQYSVDQGDGPSARGSLALKAGVPYTFEMVGDNFDKYPFALTTSSSGKASPILSAGVTSKSPATADDDKLVFTPAATGATTFYYQTIKDKPNMGGSVSIVNSCTASERNICVTMDGGSPGNFLLDQGRGPVANAQLTLTAGTTYTFEATGESFQTNPFALTQQPPLASGPAASFQPLVDGVEGDNPASDDDMRLIYTPQEVGPTTVYYQSAASATKGGRLHIVGACQPSFKRICVTQVDGAFAVAHGPDAHAEPRGSLLLNAGESYVFEMSDVGNSFEKQPFQLTLSPSGGPSAVRLTEHINGSNPGIADDQVLVYTPQPRGFAQLFYQSANSSGMGGLITIANTCNPSHDNICIYLSTGAMPGTYLVDQGEGATKRGGVKLYTGTEYTFEAVGPAFATKPMALTTSAVKANTPLTKNVYGDNPLSKDDDRLLFIPDDTTPSSLYYQSLLYSNMGGPITVLEGPSPYAPSPKPTMYSAPAPSSLSIAPPSAPPTALFSTATRTRTRTSTSSAEPESTSDTTSDTTSETPESTTTIDASSNSNSDSEPGSEPKVSRTSSSSSSSSSEETSSSATGGSNSMVKSSSRRVTHVTARAKPEGAEPIRTHSDTQLTEESMEMLSDGSSGGSLWVENMTSIVNTVTTSGSTGSSSIDDLSTDATSSAISDDTAPTTTTLLQPRPTLVYMSSTAGDWHHASSSSSSSSSSGPAQQHGMAVARMAAAPIVVVAALTIVAAAAVPLLIFAR